MTVKFHIPPIKTAAFYLGIFIFARREIDKYDVCINI